MAQIHQCKRRQLIFGRQASKVWYRRTNTRPGHSYLEVKIPQNIQNLLNLDEKAILLVNSVHGTLQMLQTLMLNGGRLNLTCHQKLI